MKGKKGPLSNLVDNPDPEQVLEDTDDVPREVIEKVLQEVGSLQYAMVMERMCGLEDKLDEVFIKMEEINKLLKNKLKD